MIQKIYHKVEKIDTGKRGCIALLYSMSFTIVYLIASLLNVSQIILAIFLFFFITPISIYIIPCYVKKFIEGFIQIKIPDNKVEEPDIDKRIIVGIIYMFIMAIIYSILIIININEKTVELIALLTILPISIYMFPACINDIARK